MSKWQIENYEIVNHSGFTLTQIKCKGIYTFRKSQGIPFSGTSYSEPSLRARSKTCRSSTALRYGNGRFYDIRPLTRIRTAQW